MRLSEHSFEQQVTKDHLQEWYAIQGVYSANTEPVDTLCLINPTGMK